MNLNAKDRQLLRNMRLHHYEEVMKLRAQITNDNNLALRCDAVRKVFVDRAIKKTRRRMSFHLECVAVLDTLFEKGDTAYNDYLKKFKSSCQTQHTIQNDTQP